MGLYSLLSPDAYPINMYVTASKLSALHKGYGADCCVDVFITPFSLLCHQESHASKV